jgi:two-component system NtrC family response regulator
MAKPKILIIDDDKALLTQLKLGLSKNYNITVGDDRKTAGKILAGDKFDLMLLDLHLPPSPDTPDEGMKLLDDLKKKSSDMLVVVITGNDDKENAIRAIEKGAYDYFTKPFDFSELEMIIKRAFSKLKLEMENRKLKMRLKQTGVYSNIIGNSRKMREVYDLMRSASDSEANLIITGESGTGKELVARAIHEKSSRNRYPFIVINCGALSGNLLEDELFGHEKGAFTGAVSRREGRFEAANKGTVFLDEISSVSLKLQTTLLRVIQEKEFERLGSSRTLNADVRIISATNQPLENLLGDKILREDFYYRINVFTIHLPPLRERKEDIILLTDHFISMYNRKNRKKVLGLSKEVLDAFEKYSWPGNVRELENVIERAVILASQRELLLQDLPDYIYTGGREIEGSADIKPPSFSGNSFKLTKYLSGIEKSILLERLEKNKWNKKKTAEELGITYRQIKYLSDKYKI